MINSQIRSLNKFLAQQNQQIKQGIKQFSAQYKERLASRKPHDDLQTGNCQMLVLDSHLFEKYPLVVRPHGLRSSLLE